MRLGNWWLLITLVIAAPSYAATTATASCDKPKPEVRTVCNIGWSGSGCKQLSIEDHTSCPATVAVATKSPPTQAPVAGIMLTGVLSPPATLSAEQDRDARAQKILAELDKSPLDEKAQEGAREVIEQCKNAQTIDAMHTCSGFLVTPVTRLNCFGSGACAPLPWSPSAVPNGHPQWFGWQTYSDTTDVDIAVLARPWITTPEIAKKCADVSRGNKGEIQETRFVNCLAKQMGGAGTRRAMQCYQQYLRSPSRFSACLEGVEVSSSDELEINCVLGIQKFDRSCVRVLHLTPDETKKCLDQGAQGPSALATCLQQLPGRLSLFGQCGVAAGGDATMLGQCIKGAVSLAKRSGATLATACVTEAIAKEPKDGAARQDAVLKCVSNDEKAKAVRRLVTKNKALINCLSDPHLDLEHRSDCLREVGVQLPPKAQLATCLGSAHAPLDAAECAGLKGATDIRRYQACADKVASDPSSAMACADSLSKNTAMQSAGCVVSAHDGISALRCVNSKDADSLAEAEHCFDLAKNGQDVGVECAARLSKQPQVRLAACVAKAKNGLDIATCAQLPGAALARAAATCFGSTPSDVESSVECLAGQSGFGIAKSALCAVKAHTGLDLAACAGNKSVAQLIAVKECLDKGGDDLGREALCVAAQAGLPPNVAHLVSCASNSASYEEGAACIITPALSPQMALAVQCGAESQGSPTGMAICLAGPKMNAELRIAAECLASTGGVPVTFAACAGGRLTLKEIQQCISGGFRSSHGCFGKNNEIVKAFDAQEKILRGVMRAAGLEHAYNNLLSDLHSGRLGKNNDIVRAYEALNHISIKSAATAASSLIHDFGMYGEILVGGSPQLRSAVSAANKVLAETLRAMMPPVPTVTLGRDHIAVSFGNSGVDISHGHVGGSLFRKRWSL